MTGTTLEPAMFQLSLFQTTLIIACKYSMKTRELMSAPSTVIHPLSHTTSTWVEPTAQIWINFPVNDSNLPIHTEFLPLQSGNSGGPVFDCVTGKVIGHTVSTQCAVSEACPADIEAWSEDFLKNSQNYRKATDIINPHLAQEYPDDQGFRVSPKFHRTLSGEPNGGALFTNVTFVCPGDIAANGKMQPLDTHQAVFNRHRWNSTDVVFRNLTGRIDRIYLFTRPLSLIANECKFTFLAS